MSQIKIKQELFKQCTAFVNKRLQTVEEIISSNQKGLQVIVLEHAYFHKNEKYKKATKYKWPRNGEERLIPNDWPDFSK